MWRCARFARAPASAEERQVQAVLPCARYRCFIAGIGMSHDTRSRIVPQHTLNATCGGWRSITDNDDARMLGVANANTAAVVDGHPTGAASCIHQRI